MKIRFEPLGVLQRKAGSEPIVLEIGSCVSVAEALALLEDARPELRGELDACAIACGDQLVARRDTVLPGSTLALLPPVAGG